MKKGMTVVFSVAVMGAFWATVGNVANAHERFHDHRSHIGFYLGSPWVWGPYPYFPPVRAIPAPAPQPAVEAAARTDAAAPGAYWYYCADANSYYPYVRTCASGWMQVVPPRRTSN